MKKGLALLLTLTMVAVFMMAMTATTFAADSSVIGLDLGSINGAIDALADFVKKITTLPTLLNNLTTAIEALKNALTAIITIFGAL